MKIKIYMKSGNTILVRHIKDWTITTYGEEVTKVNFVWSWTRKFSSKRCIVESLCLSQIEAMEQV